ncbi:MAG: hypothetical protein ABIA59_05035 [Candidatus Latescibacterota bacterium]
MKRPSVLFVLLLFLPCLSLSTTSHDLRSRIQIDGSVNEYELDEWILDAATDFAEHGGDSHWGIDNDIHAIALTWDLYNVYIAVSCVAANSTLMLLLDTECGGAGDLAQLDYFRRNIRFGEFTPNFIVATTSSPDEVTAGYFDCTGPIVLLARDQVEAWFAQDGLEGGALEVAIPWEELGRYERSGASIKMPDGGASLRLLAVITGGEGSGVGDAAPDPAAVLENDPARTALCDNTIRIPLDADGDGMLDMEVSPRETVSFALTGVSSEREKLPLGLEIAAKVIAPETGQQLEFFLQLMLDSYSLPVYLTARVFSSSGELVDVIYEDSPRHFSSAASAVWDTWDGRDSHGNIVPGGVYILTVSAGPAKGAAETVRASFAVIR